MTKSTLVTILLLTRFADAQPEGTLAVKIGPNITTWDRENRTHKYGLSGGLAGGLQWPLGRRFSLGGQTELLYTPRGADAVFEGEYIGTFRQHYLDVAFAIRPGARFGSVGAYLLLGASWNVLLDANRVDSLGREDDITLRRHDVALLASVGGALHLPSRGLGSFRLGTVFVEVRHERGLIDIDPADDNRAKNRTTALMVGLSFAWGSSTSTTSRDPAGTAASLTK